MGSEAVHYFTVHSISWRALPKELGPWNTVWKRFWRLSKAGVVEAMSDQLAATCESAHLVQLFDSIIARDHVSAAGAKREQDSQTLGRSRAAYPPTSI